MIGSGRLSSEADVLKAAERKEAFTVAQTPNLGHKNWTADPTWTQAEFDKYLCGNITGGFSSMLLVQSLPKHPLPDCFFDQLGSLTDLILRNMVLNANNTFLDPLERLGEAAAQLETFQCDHCLITNYDGSTPANINWNAAFGEFDKLTLLTLRYPTISPATILPLSLPSHLHTFIVTDSRLGGSIPTTFLSQFTTSIPTLDLSSNQLTGSLPETLFAHLNHPLILTLKVNLKQNRLNGYVSSNTFMGNWSALVELSFDISSNELSGPLDCFDYMTLNSAIKTIDLILGFNQFTGTVPRWYPSLSPRSNIAIFSLQAQSNLLSGTIPSNLLSSLYLAGSNARISLNLHGNQLTGDVPSGLLTFPGATFSPYDWHVDLSSNRLNGTIGAGLLSSLKWTNTRSASLDISGNLLSGNGPDDMLSGNLAPYLSSYKVNFSNNTKLTGSLPSTFLSSLNPSTPASSTIVVSLDMSSTSLFGTLTLPDLPNRQNRPLLISLFASNSQFVGFAVEGNASKHYVTLDFTNSTSMSGSLPDAVFNPAISGVTTFQAQGTAFTGSMPDLGGLKSRLSSIGMQNTRLNFCAPRSAWTGSPSCDLRRTNAIDCRNLYPATCAFSAPPPASPTPAPLFTIPPFQVAPQRMLEPPTTSPISPPPMTAPPTVPPTAPPTVPPTAPPTEEETPMGVTPPVSQVPAPMAPRCSPANPPSPDFYCLNGSWVSNTSVTAPIFTVPPRSSTTVINGNLTTSQVVFEGLDSTIVVQGCISNLTSITLQLTPEELERIGKSGKTQSFLRYNSTDAACKEALESVELNTQVKGSSCRKVSASKIESDGAFSGILRVDSSQCNVWWIVLVSVACAVVIIGVIVTVVVVKVLQSSKARRETTQLRQG